MLASDDKAHEECGIFGVYGVEDACGLIYRGLFSLQHRGQEGSGIVVADGQRVRSAKGTGLLNETFSEKNMRELKGSLGIGHVRYSTTGSSKIHNVQPLVVECVDGLWAVAHNGNLVNADKLRRMYQESGSIFQTSSDSEVLLHLLADPMFRRRPKRVARALGELKGAFAFTMMTARCLMAARDPFGFRPLSIGTLPDGGYVVASETCALNQVGARFLRDVEPGELVIFDETGMRSVLFAERAPCLGQCVFELVYFARPDSRVFGESVHGVRMAYGMRLAREFPVEADIVTSVPDSGNSAALGFSRESGIPLDYGFIRNHYVGRTFIMPGADQRRVGTDMKLAVLEEVVRDRRVVVVDDSIVRGTTARRRVRALREAGAREVHVRISCPPVIWPCFYGIDFATREELIAADRNVEEIRAFLEADSLGYLSVDGLLAPLRAPDDYCRACFTGEYPVDTAGIQSKGQWENGNLELDLEPTGEG
jgi:amidophosphoribosyltransferase